MTSRLLFLSYLVSITHHTSGMAISSSKSSKKKLLTNERKGATGFGSTPAPTFTHVADNAPEIETLVQFLKAQKAEGISADKTQVGFNSDAADALRGMYAMENFKKGDIICKIPSDMALALSDPALGGVDIPTQAHAGESFLNLYANHPEGHVAWAPYLDTLPMPGSHFDPTPDFWNDDEIEQLEFPRAIAAAKKRRSEIKELLAEKSSEMSMEELQFATWIVASRRFNIQISEAVADSDKEGDAMATEQRVVSLLLPYIDMINHSSNNPNCELHLIDPEKDEAWFAIRARRPVKAGKEITITYGTGIASSDEILCNYGFVPDENKIDKMMMKKGGDEIIEKLDGWKTPLEEDIKSFETAEGNLRTALALRIKLKQATEKNK